MKDKNEFAKENVVEDYLADLLTESVPESIFDKAAAQKLLDQASEKRQEELNRLLEKNMEIKSEQSPEPFLKAMVAPETTNLGVQRQIIQQDDKEIQIQVETETSRLEVSAPTSLQDSLDERFQALFFEVAGLTLAVPLIELGGIHEITKIAPLIGKPNWFMGVMLKNEDKFNVVDSARWVMPEKYDEKMAEDLNYRFLINLGKTPWGLACEKLVNTVELNKSDVKWRNNSGKRPWLAGMVKERMCALINVEELVEMLKAGLGSK
jgi:purine-binding chemotaxis protein CheW